MSDPKSSSGSQNAKVAPNKPMMLTALKKRVILDFLLRNLQLPHKYDPVESPGWMRSRTQLLQGKPVYLRSSESDIKGWLNSCYKNLVDKIRTAYKIPRSKRTCRCCSSSRKFSQKKKTGSNKMDAVNLVSNRLEGRKELMEESSDVPMEPVNPTSPVETEVKVDKAQIFDVADTSSGSTSKGSLNAQPTSNFEAPTEQRDKIILAYHLNKTLKFPYKFGRVGSPKWITMMAQLLWKPEHGSPSKSDIERWLNLICFKKLVDQSRALYEKHGNVSRSKQQGPWSSVLESLLALFLDNRKDEQKSKEKSAVCQVEAVKSKAVK